MKYDVIVVGGGSAGSVVVSHVLSVYHELI